MVHQEVRGADARAALGWPSIAAGQNTLILAPTGSGKTLAAFLWAINHLVDQKVREQLAPGVRILYVSPLKALNNDIERNLREPLQGIREEAERLGIALPPVRAAVRTGDTPQSERARMTAHPPDILITTPESLYLMLTSGRTRAILRSVQYVIVDEIHALCGNKRGVHLSLSLERLQDLAEQEFVRIGLSATQSPLETIAAYLGGGMEHGERSGGGAAAAAGSDRGHRRRAYGSPGELPGRGLFPASGGGRLAGRFTRSSCGRSACTGRRWSSSITAGLPSGSPPG